MQNRKVAILPLIAGMLMATAAYMLVDAGAALLSDDSSAPPSTTPQVEGPPAPPSPPAVLAPADTPVPDLLGLPPSAGAAPDVLTLDGLVAQRLDSGPWGATYALPRGSDPRLWANAVSGAEPIWTRTLAGTSINDPGFQRQFYLADLHVVDLRRRGTGAGVKVAVIDTGVTAGEDGPARVLEGWNLFDDTEGGADQQGHGSDVAAVIAQSTNNRRGFASIAPSVEILPIRACSAEGVCTSDRVAEAIRMAVRNGADLINLGVAGLSRSQMEADAIDEASRWGVLVVAPAGNASGTVGYPAALPEVIAVAAVTADNAPASYSNRGEEVDFWAPGGDAVRPLLIEGPGGEEGVWGTSFAAPLVTASIAVAMSSGFDARSAVDALSCTGLVSDQVEGVLIRPWLLWSTLKGTRRGPSVPMTRIEGGRLLPEGLPSYSGGQRPRPLEEWVSTFHIGEHEITLYEWNSVLDAAQKATISVPELKQLKPRGAACPEARESLATDANVGDWYAPYRMPIRDVTWCDAARFANVLSRLKGFTPVYDLDSGCSGKQDVPWREGANGYHLPTEAQWEYVAQQTLASSPGSRSPSLDVQRSSWNLTSSGGKVHPVCTAATQPLGLCDLFGNVSEWLSDLYLKESKKGKIEVVRTSSSCDAPPVRVFRGGFWETSGTARAMLERAGAAPTSRASSRGFRLARPDGTYMETLEPVVVVSPGGDDTTPSFRLGAP